MARGSLKKAAHSVRRPGGVTRKPPDTGWPGAVDLARGLEHRHHALVPAAVSDHRQADPAAGVVDRLQEDLVLLDKFGAEVLQTRLPEVPMELDEEG